MRTHLLVSWGFWGGHSVGGGVTEPMGAKLTICCCRYYLFPNRDEKNAILRWDKHKKRWPSWCQLDGICHHNILKLFSLPMSPACATPQLLDSHGWYRVIPARLKPQMGRTFSAPRLPERPAGVASQSRGALRTQGSSWAGRVNLPSDRGWTRSCRHLSAWETRLTRQQR